ncbi:hypothetical protein [Luteibacter sp. 22Crub2.1]|uniref:hypothetical protein n=1 Tax=Luteibacter sp. 22Crub2.1 TaxID=1283288 RepID=UPI0009CDDB25|nr:hypothetical protein [Luteibacter sp. 22Crub2.1]SKB85742.1 hypothetical protein SAMN05660880_02943 [Luteibacter sp. 22Crub2.1]
MSIWDDLQQETSFISAIEDAVRNRINSIADSMQVPTGGQESVALSGASGIDIQFGPATLDDLTISAEITGQALASASWMDGGNDAKPEEREVDVQLSGFLSISMPSDFLLIPLADLAVQLEIDTDDIDVDFELEDQELDDYDGLDNE